MGRHIIATKKGGDYVTEARAGLASAYPGTGYAWTDPAAIPPPGLGNMQRAGVLVTTHTLLQVDVVFTCLRIISTAILEMGNPRAYSEKLDSNNIPYKAYSPKQPDILIDTFGGRHFQYDGWRRTVMSLGLFGEAFWYTVARDDSPKRFGLPMALEVLHPAFMEVKADEEGNPIFLYGAGANRKVLDPEDVIHIPFMALPQARRALNTTEYVGVAAALAMAAYEFGSAWFSQGAAPSFLLSTDQKLGQDECNRIAMKFQIEHSGLQAAHLPLVLDSGIKATKIMASPDEAQYLNTLEFSRSVLSSWFGVPETLLPNALQRQPAPAPHTSEEEVRRFVLYTLSGYTTPIEQALSDRCLLPNEKAGYERDGLSRPDSQFLSQEIMALRQSQAATINDIRVRKLRWAPLPHPEADDPIQPLASNTDQSEGGTPPPAAPAKPAPKPAPKKPTGGAPAAKSPTKK